MTEATERAREALTPYGVTKAAYMGEFSWTEWLPDANGIEQGYERVVPWTTIKEIMRAIRERASLDLLDEADAHSVLISTPAEARLSDGRVEVLREAAQAVLDRMFGTYKARNGRHVGIQGDDGEKCWIVHSDDIENLRAALASTPDQAETAEVATPAGEMCACPFCGARAHRDETIEVEEDTYGSRLLCPGCGAAGPRASDDDGDPNELELWNRRHVATPAAPQAAARDGLVEHDPLVNKSPGVLQDARDFVEQWRAAVAIGSGHDMAANTTTVRRFIRVIDSLCDDIARAERGEG